MEKTGNITLVATCNNHFSLMLGALIRSIGENHTSINQIDLYIVDDHISDRNKTRLANCADESNINIIWLSSEIIFENEKLPIDNSSFPRNVYMRLFIPSFLPKGVKKAIYLDVDMICCKDITKLWEIDLQDQPIAAVKDRSGVVSSEWGGIANYKELGLDPNTPYFNTGLIMFNTDVWRKEGITQQIIKAVEDNIKHAGFPDQYGLNVVLARRCLSLDFRWNCYSMLDEKEPFIIHFIGNKPIYKSYSDNENYSNEFFRYLKSTPWKDFRPYSTYMRYWNKALNIIKNKLHIVK